MNKLILDELRHLILQKFTICKISPSDCQYIALEISRKTKKNISATTIKRIFGFAATNHLFSKFTINTIIDFLENDQRLTSKYLIDENEKLIELRKSFSIVNKSKEISIESFKEVIGNATVPFDFTIERKFAAYDFETFYHSNYTFTAFIAQSGYGKSILMSHLVNNNFLKKNAKYKNDIVLYLTAEKIFNNNNDFIDLEQRIFEILDIKTQQNLVEYFHNIFEKSGRKLIIIVESLYGACWEKGTKQRIFNSIVQFLVNIEQADFIKFIFGARTYIWRRFYDNIKHSVFLKSKWFKGSYYNEHGHHNVPVFSSSEVKQLLEKIGLFDHNLHPYVLSEIKYPFYYANFYHFKAHSDLGSKLIYYKLLHKFIEEKFYNSSNQTDKLSVCKLIVELSNFGKNGAMINKSLLIGDLNKFKTAYMQLLAEGILTEEKHEFKGFNVEFVKFNQPGLFDYFLYKSFAEKRNAQYSKLTNDVNYPNVKEAINWVIFNAIHQNKYQDINEILKLSLKPKEFTEILVLMSDQLKCKFKNMPETIDEDQILPIEITFLDKLIDLDFLDPSFVNVLNVLINISNNEHTKIHYYNLLTLHDCLTLNIIGLENRLAFFKNLHYHNTEDCIDPIELINHVIAKLTCQNYNRQFLLAQYHYFISLNKTNNERAKLIEITLTILEWLFDDGNTLIKKIAYQRFLKPFNRNTHSIHFQYLIHLLRTNNLSNKNNVKVRQLDNLISRHTVRYPNQTFFCNALNYLIKIQKHIQLGYYMLAIADIERAVIFYRQYEYKFMEIKCYRLAIVIYTHLADDDKVIEYKYLIMNMLEDENLKKYKFKLSLINS